MSRVAKDDEGDTIYAVDRVSESAIVDFFRGDSLSEPVLLIAEGLDDDGRS